MNKVNIACVFLASGFSERFGDNKLMAELYGKPLAQIVLDSHAAELFLQTVVVTRYPQVALFASLRGFTVCENLNPENDISHTISLGISALSKGLNGCMFSTCDMPFFTKESCAALVNKFAENPDKIVAAAANGTRQSPVIFPARFFSALKQLPFNTGGNFIIKQNLQSLVTVNLPENELKDIDTKQDLTALKPNGG